jgi:DNA polymerase I
MPARIIDLFVEFRDRTNRIAQRRKPGVKSPSAGLIDALAHFGLDTIGSIEKDEMRKLILRGGPWTENESAAILDYCGADTATLERLWWAMLPGLDIPRALLRGRYMAAAAAMEHAGVPIDTATLGLLREHWTGIQDDLIAAIDVNYRVFEGHTFKTERWAAYLAAKGIPWPRLESGQLDLGDKTFREMAKAYPAVSPMRELRSALSELRLNDLAVGRDGRNRTLLSAFRSGTGRNQPSNAKFIFGPSVWLRGLIQPPPGHGIAYIDWSQQEFGIAAALSGDEAMQAAYRSGDPYLTFAKQSGAVPADATKRTHGAIRELYKQCVLAVQYGMGADSLALRIGQPTVVARQLLLAHHDTYRRFWKWSDAIVDYTMLRGSLHTACGWHGHIGDDTNPRSLRNFPMQGNGAEMLRLACCLGTERGIEICAPVHDAVLICAPLDRLDSDVAVMRGAMASASRTVLAGFGLSSDAHVTCYPDRYRDPGGRGDVMWQQVMALIAKQKAAAA